MKAVAIEKFGGREVLQWMDLPKPEAGPGELLIRVRAAGVNPVDWKIREGLLQGRLPHQFPLVLGWDAAGVVEAIGAGVKRLRTGDAVMTYARKPVIQGGTYADYVVVPEANAAPKPARLSFEEAAVLPLSGLTAWQALFDAAHLQAGETVLIHAGAGGVGGYAIQLAKNVGAHVITTASAANHDTVRDLGADAIIDYRKEDFVAAVRRRHPEGIDVAFDTVGESVQEKSAAVLKKGGRLVSILAIPQATAFEQRGIAVHYVFVAPNASELEKLGQLAEAGKLKVSLEAVFPLAEAARAHEMIETGHTRGKIALLV